MKFMENDILKYFWIIPVILLFTSSIYCTYRWVDVKIYENFSPIIRSFIFFYFLFYIYNELKKNKKITVNLFFSSFFLLLYNPFSNFLSLKLFRYDIYVILIFNILCIFMILYQNLNFLTLKNYIMTYRKHLIYSLTSLVIVLIILMIFEKIQRYYVEKSYKKIENIKSENMSGDVTFNKKINQTTHEKIYVKENQEIAFRGVVFSEGSSRYCSIVPIEYKFFSAEYPLDSFNKVIIKDVNCYEIIGKKVSVVGDVYYSDSKIGKSLQMNVKTLKLDIEN
jgi:hypothetical protein